MRYLIVMVLLLMNTTLSFSQNFEVGPYVGGSNYIGDVGNSTFIRPSDLVFGGIFKWNQSTRHSFRFSLLHANIHGDDNKSSDTRRQERGYSFTNSITEASLGLEFNFFDYNPRSGAEQATPYLYSGINYYFADHFQLDGGELQEAGNNWEFSIPMVMGYKLTFTSILSGGVELGARYTFTDNLDGSKPSEVDGALEHLDFGNTNTTDWYVFTGIYLTINFGNLPCFTNF